jgi:hypothetical protein
LGVSHSSNIMRLSVQDALPICLASTNEIKRNRREG